MTPYTHTAILHSIGNKKGFEEAYYLKRISKGWVFRSFPGPWQAFLERPDGTVELLKSYKTKPELREVATLVREESFQVRWFIFCECANSSWVCSSAPTHLTIISLRRLFRGTRFTTTAGLLASESGCKHI